MISIGLVCALTYLTFQTGIARYFIVFLAIIHLSLTHRVKPMTRFLVGLFICIYSVFCPSLKCLLMDSVVGEMIAWVALAISVIVRTTGESSCLSVGCRNLPFVDSTGVPSNSLFTGCLFSAPTYFYAAWYGVLNSDCP